MCVEGEVDPAEGRTIAAGGSVESSAIPGAQDQRPLKCTSTVGKEVEEVY